MSLNRVSCIMVCILACASVCMIAVRRPSYPSDYVKSESGDGILWKIGTPSDVQESLDEGMKEYICENMGKEEQFESYECVPMVKKGQNSDQPYSDSSQPIEKKDMILSIFTTKALLGGVDHTRIYVSFKWNRSTNLKNDVFAVALNSGWVTNYITKQPQLIVRAMNKEDEVVASRSILPMVDYSAGFEFHISGGAVVLPLGGYYDGYMDLYAKKTKKDAPKGCLINYVHDSTGGLSRESYNVLLESGIISVTGDKKKLDIYVKEADFSYENK